MTARRAAEIALRTLAVAIAVAAAIDPALSSSHVSHPVISIIAADPARDSALVREAGATLEDRFTIVPGPFPSDASVLVGDALPDDVGELSSPVFAIAHRSTGSEVELESVTAPSRAALDARVPVTAVLRAVGARTRVLDVTLRSNGLVVDRVARTLSSADEHIVIPLSFLPPAAGVAPLHIDATTEKSDAVARADLSVDVRDTRWSVLFYDARPSWMSTFVRRAVERDRRFVVTSRVVTSRNLSTDVGRPPARLDDLEGTSHFDAIVIGAPDALSRAEVAGIDEYLRRRGGSVVLLLDQRAAGPYEELIGSSTSTWPTKSLGVGVRIGAAGGDTVSLRSSETAWPNTLPPGAVPLAVALPTAGDSGRGRTIVWKSPVGGGRVIVSGAFDAWRFRDRGQSDFERFWQSLVADAANLAPPPVSVSPARSVLAPGEESDIAVTVRRAAFASLDATAAPIDASVAVAVLAPAAAGARREVLHVMPSGSIGELHGTFRAPRAPGVYRVVASADGATADAAIVVAPDARRAGGDSRDARALVAAYVASRGGRVVADTEPHALTAGLTSALRPAARAELWHPMRSPWWIVPFALALSAEWWLRRRRGLS